MSDVLTAEKFSRSKERIELCLYEADYFPASDEVLDVLKHAEALQAENDALKEKLRVAEEALEIYSDPGAGKDEYGDDLPTPDFYYEMDFSRFATKALNKIRGEA